MRTPVRRAPGGFEPSRLEVRWQKRAANIFENLWVVVRGPRDVWGLHAAESFFRLRVPPARRRGWQLAGSLVCHALLLFGVLGIRRTATLPPAPLSLPEVHIAWYGPVRDVVPRIAPPRTQSEPKAQARPERPRRQVVTRGYNPNTTVVFRPPHATNSRQLLIQPQAPPQLPKFLPAMPNIIQWEAGRPAPPAIAIHPNQLRAVRGKRSKQARLSAPRIAYRAAQGPMGMLSSPSPSVTPPFSSPKAIHGVHAGFHGARGAGAPALAGVGPARGHFAFSEGSGAAPAPPLPGAIGAIHARRGASHHLAAQGSPAVGNPSPGSSTLDLPGATSGGVPLPPLSSAPKAVRAQSSNGSNGSGSGMAAPGIGPPARRMVSLSLSPGKTPPPPGNAYAPMSIGPHPGRKGLPAASSLGPSGGTGKVPGFPAPEGSATGPQGLLILHDANSPAPPPAPQPPASAAPKPARIAPRPVAAAMPRPPIPRPEPVNPPVNGKLSHGPSRIVPRSISPGPISVAHNVILVGVVLQNPVDRPSATWQMPTLPMNLPKLSNTRGTWVLDFAKPMPLALREQNKVIVPIPARAVEPQYPAALQREGVRGKVVLSAVIGRDGKVSRIRVTESLNPVLDQKAEAAFSRWKFEPALLGSKPIAVPVIVTVPFHYVSTLH